MKKIKNYFSLVKFSHTVFAMPFALIGFFMAVQKYDFDPLILIFVVLCMIFARNAAMGFNRWTDRYIDKKNPRTSNREIPSGKIKAISALWFVITNCIMFITATWFINRLVFFLSPIALIVILGYSYTKRFTSLCHFILGLGLSLAPIGAYLSVSAQFALTPVLLSCAVLLWVSGFDIIYALQDIGFDKKQKLKSIPVLLGKKQALLLSVVLHVVCFALVLTVGYLSEFNLWYWIGASIFSLLLLYQHLIVKPNDLSRVNLAFFTTNGIASFVFAFFTIFSIFY